MRGGGHKTCESEPSSQHPASFGTARPIERVRARQMTTELRIIAEPSSRVETR